MAIPGLVGALIRFLFVFYFTCMGLTWWRYRRTRSLVRRIPSLAEADA